VSFCRHCKEVIPMLDDVKYHICIEGKEDLLEGEKDLYSPTVNEIPCK